MKNWQIEYDIKFQRIYKKYQKKRPNELLAVMDNLDTYCEALDKVKNHLNVKAGFIHKERKGIIAIDQKGGGRKQKLRQTRLYIFVNNDTKILYVLTLGDKNSQKNDIVYCRSMVEKIKRG